MYPPMLAMLLVGVGVAATVEVEVLRPPAENATVKDFTIKNSIKEMMDKLEAVVGGSRGFCPGPEKVEPAKPCIDVTSSQSVLTQICDRLTHLDSRVSSVDSKINVLVTPNNTSGEADDTNKSFTEIAKLKEEIQELKKSAIFYANRKDKVVNLSQGRVLNYEAVVNKGEYFNAEKGAFYTPFSGVYHFSITYLKAPEAEIESSLIIDNVIIASTSDDPQNTIDIFTPLKQGQEVWTNSTAGNAAGDSEVTIIFFGYLIH